VSWLDLMLPLPVFLTIIRISRTGLVLGLPRDAVI
jgi:hypothetical protein